MYLKRFGFPSHSEERGYLVNCDAADDNVTPFGIFPKRSLEHIDFSDVTILCGSSDSEKDLVLELIAQKLGVGDLKSKLSASIVNGYLGMCYTRYAEYIEKRTDVDKIYVSRDSALSYLDKNRYCFDGNNTLLHFYENEIEGKTICLLQEPETCMSFEETVALACLIEDFVSYSKTQFIISTNSPAILGIKNALIYDFDDRIVVGRTWCSSAKALKHITFYQELVQKHKT